MSRVHSRARSSAITLAHTTESAAVQGSGSNPTTRNSGGQRPRPRLHPRVDPVHVGVEPAMRVRGEVGQGGLRPAVKTERPQQPVGAEGGRAQHLGEAPRPDPPVHLHLPQPVLGMDVAEGEEGILLVSGEDVRDAVPVANHLHRRGEARRGPFAVDLGERTAEPQVPAPSRRRGQHDQREHHPAQPLQRRGHWRPPFNRPALSIRPYEAPDPIRDRGPHAGNRGRADRDGAINTAPLPVASTGSGPSPARPAFG